MTNVRNRYRVVTAMVAAAMSLCVACSSGESDEAKVKTVLKSFLTDAADGRGAEACSLLTGDAVRYVSTVGAVAGSPASCPDAVRTLSGLFAQDEKKALKSANVKRVSVSGDRATIAHQDIEIRFQGQSHLFKPESSAPVVAVKTDAGWKIESLG